MFFFQNSFKSSKNISPQNQGQVIAHSSKVRFGLTILSSKNTFLIQSQWQSGQAHWWLLKEKLEILKSKGICQQFEQTKIFEKDLSIDFSQVKKLISSCQIHIL